MLSDWHRTTVDILYKKDILYIRFDVFDELVDG